MSQLTKQQLKGENQTQFPNNNVGAITPSHLRAFNVDMIDSTVNQTDFTNFSGSVAGEIDALEAFSSSLTTAFVSTASFNSYTQSNDAVVNALVAATASYATAAITGSSLITASVSLNTITFTKGDNTTFALTVDTGSGGGGGNISVQDEGSILGNATSFNFNGAGVSATLSAGTASITIPGGGGSIDTGSFATTGSNTFNGDQNISGSIFFANGTEIKGNAGQQTSLNSPVNSLLLASSVNMTISGSNITMQSAINNITASQYNTLEAPRTDIRGVETIGDTGTGNGEVYLLGRSGSLILGNSTATPTYAGLSHISSSQINANTNLIFKSNTNTVPTIVSGSSNIFTNQSTGTTGYVRYVGGSSNIYMNAIGIPQLTGSAASVSGNRPIMNGNIIPHQSGLVINQSVNPGIWNINGNILTNVGSTTFNALGNTGNITFSGNIGATAGATINSPSRSIAEVNAGASGSSPLTIQNNLLLASNIQYQGPVSSSAHGISTNIIQGSLFANLQSGSRVYTINANSINGTLSIDDNTVFAPTLGSNHTYSNNIINGAAIFINQASSSFNVGNNNLNGITITTRLDSSGVTLAGVRTSVVTANALFGAQNNILFSGSMGANPTSRTFSANLIAGSFISASLVGDGGSKSMGGTAILGSGLNVFGTAKNDLSGVPLANIGSLFAGRYNAADGNRAGSAETVFAVGTGNSGSAGIFRKTGFLIDSGSNTYVEGTLNVSGSTTMTGSLLISSSATYDLIITGAARVVSEDGLQINTIGPNTFNIDTTRDASVNAENYIFGSTGSVSSIYVGVYDSPAFNTDVELKISADSNGLSFNDWDNVDGAYESWLTLDANVGNNPIPTFTRGLNVTGSTNMTGSLTIQSGSGDLYVHGHKQFNVGDFYSTQTQTLAAGVSGSATFNNTGVSQGVSVVSNSQLTIANAGVYSITFSAQIKADGGQDIIYMWLKKNGTNVANTATKLVAKNNEESVMTVEFIVDAANNDYYEIAWQNDNGYADLLYAAASGNIPAIPSIIASVKQCR